MEAGAELRIRNDADAQTHLLQPRGLCTGMKGRCNVTSINKTSHRSETPRNGHDSFNFLMNQSAPKNRNKDGWKEEGKHFDNPMLPWISHS